MFPTTKISVSASFLLLECLEKIFSYLIDKNLSHNIYTSMSMKDIHSCTLVSRHWCRISTSFLYAYPFHYFRHLADSVSYNSDHLQYFKLIRTLLSCIPKSEIEKIKSSNSSNTQKLSSNFDISSTFNYITFIRGLILDKLKILYNPHTLFIYRNLWLPSYNAYNITEDQFSKISIPIINHLVRFLCKHCNNLKTLQFKLKIQNNEIFNNLIEFLSFKDYNGRNKLNNLKELYSINDIASKNEKLPLNLYLTLSNNKVYNLNLLYNENISTIEEANSLSKFISLQKKLQHIILSEDKLDIFLGDNRDNIGDNYDVVLSSLSSQSESLKVLELKYIPFNKIDGKALNALCSLKNIRELKFYMCRAISDKLNSWAKNLSRLEVIEFMAHYFPTISEEFLVQLIRSSSNTITKLVLHYKRAQDQSTRIFQQILHLNSLIHLELPKIYSYELILIFKSCTQLVYLSTILSDDELWENFRDLGKFIPITLRKIQFKEMHNLVFSSTELRYFLEECVNNDSNLMYLEIVGNQHVSQDYFDVAVEFGIILYYINC